MSVLFYIIAGEASGDMLGAGLMRELKARRPDIGFAGIGGPAMQAQGLGSFFDYSELSIMGFMEVLPHIPHMLRRIRQTKTDIASKQPRAVITIDSPGFCFRLAKALAADPRASAIPRIHYVAPSVWAYKPERARRTAQLFDGLLTLLPFEPPFFEKEGLKTIFVGHPVLSRETKGDAAAFRARHGIAPEAKLLLLLPGSRKGEVSRHLGLFLEAARSLADFTPVILAGHQVKSSIAEQAPGILIADIAEKQDAFAAADLALTKSGTISLELAAAGVPMVVAHRTHPVSAWIIRRMIRIEFVSLINIAARRAIIPEFLQERCIWPNIVTALDALAPPEARMRQKQQYGEAIALLRGREDGNADSRAADAVLSLLDGF